MSAMSKAQKFAAWKAERTRREQAEADARVAKYILSAASRGCKQGMGRGWKKWANKLLKATP